MTCVDVAVRHEESANTSTNFIAFNEGGSKHEIYWEHGGDLVPHEPRVADFALIAVLPYFMNRGTDVRVLGNVTRSLVEAAEECVDVWSLWRPDIFRKIRLAASNLATDQVPVGRDAVLAFSGGVDSTFTLLANKRGLLGHRNFDVKAGVMIHGFDIPVNRPDLFAKSAEHAHHILSEAKAAQVTVRTNWRDYCVDWEMAHGFGVTAILHQYHGSVSCGIWSADEAYNEEFFPWGNSSVTNPLLSGISFPVRTCGRGFTRLHKISEIAKLESARSHVRVCWERLASGLNCGACEKCVITRLFFFLAGYGDVPAFEGRLSADIVSRLRVKKAFQRDYLLSILNDPRASSLDNEVRSALERVVRTDKVRAVIGGIARKVRSALPR